MATNIVYTVTNHHLRTLRFWARPQFPCPGGRHRQRDVPGCLGTAPSGTEERPHLLACHNW
eukprot:10634514-Lingulodinium_polyedra.AAC.1